ncbi:MAG: serine--tRNA ligase [Pelagibacterales bacterium]|jgi:seryl-tRNA synthetase|nr:serine--tRNA ligase [Pelagibacterales bacterium]|tara:strand:+ start:2374 stop:3636 length:1263 start_codon:yes stop_codon:yes gene_type:complete
MFDIKKIRENPKEFDSSLAKRNFAPCSAELITIDEDNRKAIAEAQALQEERNSKSKLIGEYASSGKVEDANKLKEEVSSIKATMHELEVKQKDIAEILKNKLSIIPNLAADEVPIGGEEANQEIKVIGEKIDLGFEAKEHFDLGENLGLMDFETAAKISGARFVIQQGNLARLERSIANFMLDLHTTEFDYQEVNVPILVKNDALYGTGQLPKFEEDLFKTINDYYLIPTAEVPLTNMTRDTILNSADLPLRFVSHTPCFRSEAGAAGRDTRGIMRQHQFYKVELVSLTDDKSSKNEHERMLSCAEEVLKRLGLSYRVMLLASQDMGFSANKTYDIEVWLPGQKAYREISSCSNCGDFQSRRMNSRYKDDNSTKFIHTLNGSGLAIGRTLIAIMENYQNSDGSISIPDVLQPYMNNLKNL